MRRLRIVMIAIMAAGCAAAPAGRQTAPGGPAAARALSCNSAPQMSAEERQIVNEVNLARSQPTAYAQFVASRYDSLDQANVYRRDGMSIRMKEGRPAVDEAVRFLRAAAPRRPLLASNCLAMAARDHVRDQGPTGNVGHQGSDGSGPCDRTQRHLGQRIACGEAISYGHENPRDIVVSLIVDDGQPDRGHRNIMFDNQYKSLGVALGAHASYRVMAVQLFVTSEIDR